MHKNDSSQAGGLIQLCLGLPRLGPEPMVQICRKRGGLALWLPERAGKQNGEEGNKDPKARKTLEEVGNTWQPQKVVSEVPDTKPQYMLATSELVLLLVRAGGCGELHQKHHQLLPLISSTSMEVRLNEQTSWKANSRSELLRFYCV